MTDSDPTRSTPPEEEPAPWPQQEPDTSQPAEDPGYLTETGQAAAEDGSVAPVFGGLPAVEGSAWDIGARWKTAVPAVSADPPAYLVAGFADHDGQASPVQMNGHAQPGQDADGRVRVAVSGVQEGLPASASLPVRRHPAGQPNAGSAATCTTSPGLPRLIKPGVSSWQASRRLARRLSTPRPSALALGWRTSDAARKSRPVRANRP
jgi:hypothetical protein